MPSASLRALLNQAIDYAGMFPPCSLALEPALQNQANYVRSPERWMLNGFVLPVEQFDAARQLLSEFDPSHPLRAAALGPKTANADAFLDRSSRRRCGDSFIRKIRCRSAFRSVISRCFCQRTSISACLKEARAIVGDLPVFWEAPAERAEQTIAIARRPQFPRGGRDDSVTNCAPAE